uniref:Uncharacterized protein n=1 Tax=Vitis vinifera TaxID=29760 RepID=F6HJN6_VITVI
MILLGSFFCEKKENEVVHWFLRILERNHCWKSRDWSRSCQLLQLLGDASVMRKVLHQLALHPHKNPS